MAAIAGVKTRRAVTPLDRLFRDAARVYKYTRKAQRLCRVTRELKSGINLGPFPPNHPCSPYTLQPRPG